MLNDSVPFPGHLIFYHRIDSHFIIKITDFGLSEDMFLRNYYKEVAAGSMTKLPVKWMSPESLSDGHFSEMSDVVRMLFSTCSCRSVGSSVGKSSA